MTVDTPVAPAAADDPYLLGEDPPPPAPPTAATPPAPAQTAPQADDPPAQPRDEHGRFAPRAEAPPPSPPHPARLVQQAREAGLSDEDIAGAATPAELRLAIRDAALTHLLRLQANPVAQAPAPPSQAPAPPSPEAAEPDWGEGADPKDYDGGLVHALRALKRDHARLQHQVQQLLAFHQQQAEQTLAERADAFFARHPEVFGKGKGAEITDRNSVEWKRRVLVYREGLQGDPSEPPEARWEKARQLLVVGAPPPPAPAAKPSANGGPTPEQWAQAGLAVPTHREPPPEKPGLEKAKKTFMRLNNERTAEDGDTVE